MCEPKLADHAETSTIRLRVLSLGAGVRSTTVALMAAHGGIGPIASSIYGRTSARGCAVSSRTGRVASAIGEARPTSPIPASSWTENGASDLMPTGQRGQAIARARGVTASRALCRSGAGR
ncbi:hypothetical protein FHP24_26845 [Aliirhizobium smilacinae]|uniref:Uncharacterized protein n=1 Tax=Aliirhizobium smilacinae TaxID=1395944 RepID=A0A5C4X9N7_9HYPH|nr:hypothetical protein FHP24_26845 [Rhizobium smilacinae]